MADEQRRRPGIGEGIRSGLGVLTAFKEAIEDTVKEAAERGDLKPERAREFLNEVLGRAQHAVGDVRERLDFVPRKEFDDLKAEVEALRRRLDGGASTASSGAAMALPPVSGFGGSTAAEPPTEPGAEGPTEARMP